MDQLILLNDGSTHAAKWCGAAAHVLTMMVTDVPSVVEAAQIFGDEFATRKISVDYGGGVLETYEGYTRLVVVMVDDDLGGIMIKLREG